MALDTASSRLVKSAAELEQMRRAGRLAAACLKMIGAHVKPGISTGELDRICHDYITQDLGCYPAPLNYKGFPKSICTSVNEVVCHGIPSYSRVLKAKDAVNIDITVRTKEGFHGDTSAMFAVGEASPQITRLIKVTRECLLKGIAEVRPGARLGDIGAAIQEHAEANYYSVVRDFCGHGIGREFHEEPAVMHFGEPGCGQALVEGMCFTIEPMVNAGSAAVRVLPDGWTAVTKDGRPSAQWEHSLAVTKTGCEVLTRRPGEDLSL